MSRKLTGINFSLLGFGAGWNWENINEEKGEIEFSEIEAEIMTSLLNPRATLRLTPSTMNSYEKIHIVWEEGGEERREDEGSYLAFKKLEYNYLVENKAGIVYELTVPGKSLAEGLKALNE